MVSRIVDLDGEEPRSDVELKRVQALLPPKWSIFEERVLCAFRAKRVLSLEAVVRRGLDTGQQPNRYPVFLFGETIDEWSVGAPEQRVSMI